jgi:hypothetical protein
LGSSTAQGWRRALISRSSPAAPASAARTSAIARLGCL